jgi:hypothetical protein
MKDNEKDKKARETRTAYAAESGELQGGQMSTQTAVIKELTARIDSLEEKVRSMHLSLVRRGVLEPEERVMTISPLEMEQVVAELRQEGLIRAPTSEELEHAAAWDALPEAEKRAIDEELRHLHLEPSLSEIIGLNRARKAVES